MPVPSTIDAAAWLSKYLEGDDGDNDLARAMLQAFAETLMSAEASTRCVTSLRNPSSSTAPKPRPRWGAQRPRSMTRSHKPCPGSVTATAAPSSASCNGGEIH